MVVGECHLAFCRKALTSMVNDPTTFSHRESWVMCCFCKIFNYSLGAFCSWKGWNFGSSINKVTQISRRVQALHDGLLVIPPLAENVTPLYVCVYMYPCVYIYVHVCICMLRPEVDLRCHSCTSPRDLPVSVTQYWVASVHHQCLFFCFCFFYLGLGDSKLMFSSFRERIFLTEPLPQLPTGIANYDRSLA